MMIWIFTGRRLEQLRGEPEYTLCLVGGHELLHHWLEIGKHLDLRERFCFDWIHSRPRTGLRRAEREIYAKALPRAAGRRVNPCPGRVNTQFSARAQSHTSASRGEIHIGGESCADVALARKL